MNQMEIILSGGRMYAVLAHIIIVLCLSIYVYRKNSITNLLIVIITYLTLYFSFSFFGSLSTDLPRIVIRYFHSVGLPIGIKISSVIFLFILYVVAIYKQRLNIVSFYIAYKNLINIYLALLFIFVAAISFNASVIYERALMEVAASCLMWMFSFLTAAMLYKEDVVFVDNKNVFLGVIYLLLTIQIVICIYQIVTNSTYSTTMYSIRADGSLFNPNILGLWITFTLLVSSYLYFTKDIDVKKFTLLSVFICLLFILSSSRSMLIIGLFVSVFISILVRNDNNNVKIPLLCRFTPIGIFSGLLAFMMLLFKLLNNFFESFFLQIMAANSDRFLNTPYDVFIIVMRKTSVLLSKFKFEAPSFFNNFVTEKIAVFREQVIALPTPSGHTERAVAGRISTTTAGVDNTYLYFKTIGGGLSLTIWVSLFVVIMYLAVIKYYKIKNINSVYSLALILSVMLTGIFMRSTQLFPIWVFLSAFMGVSILWILAPFNNSKINN